METAELLSSYWGKADPSVMGAATHHTVLGHSLDVAACAFAIISRNPPLTRSLATLAALPLESVAPTFSVVITLHDIGKVDTRFQRKAPPVADLLRPHSASVPTGSYDHATEGFRQIDGDDRECDLLGLLGPDGATLLRAVCGHHGNLPLRAEPDESRSLLPAQLRNEDRQARRAFFEAVVRFFVAQGALLPWPSPVNGPVVQVLAGLCAIADWLGSNVDFFPYAAGRVQIAEYWVRALAKARIACARVGLERATPRPAGFSDLFPGLSPRDVQLVTEAVQAQEPALVVIEAEMGRGKTEAALSLGARFLQSGTTDGVMVALPTMATSNAMFARVTDAAPRLFQNAVTIALAHGRAVRNPLFAQLIHGPAYARDADAPEATVVSSRWLLKKKRVLLSQVGVGTIDQALQAALVVRHQFVRMFGLSRNVMVIDEVHAYDAYMEVLLEHLVSWLGALGVPVIVLSATLPSERRAALARAWRGVSDEPVDVETFQAASTRAYPLVTVTTKSETTELEATKRSPTRTVQVCRVPLASGEDGGVDEVASRLGEAAQRGARVVWIRNTVLEAQRAYRAVMRHGNAVPVTLFHARFRGCDRSELEARVLSTFGKGAPAGGHVLIATQVVEQSLDLDFDELHTDLAPIDLLFQRCGRLHRHVRLRPAGFEEPRFVVHSPPDEDVAALRFGASSYVYDVGTLWIANRAVASRQAFELPTDIRPLVEETYHPASRSDRLREAGPKMLELEEARHRELVARQTRARRCCIQATTADPEGEIAGDDDDDAVQAFTRDGASTTLLPFWWDGEGARALDADSDAPPWPLDSMAPDAWTLAGDLLDQTLSLPAQGDVDGETTDPAWPAWRRRFSRFAEGCSLGGRVVPLPLERRARGLFGSLRIRGQRKRVVYTREMGLFMPTDREEEHLR